MCDFNLPFFEENHVVFTSYPGNAPDHAYAVSEPPQIDIRPAVCPEIDLTAKFCSSLSHSVPFVEEVIFDEERKTTIIAWYDGDKTVVRCGDGETFDRYTGFMAAVCKKLFGGTTAAKKLMNLADKKYQAALRAEEEAKAKAKREEEAKAAKKEADKRRAKEKDMLMEAMVEHYLLEAEAKKRAEEILAARDTSSLKVPFDDAEAE